jgi:hypothetical protein
MKFRTQSLIELVEGKNTFEDRIFVAAQYYTECGIPIIPLRPGTKVLPEARTGFNYQSSTTNPKTAAKWYAPDGPFEGFGIGIACGRVGGVFAVDIDTHKDVDGAGTWRELCNGNEMFDTPVQITPSGGKHLLFLWAEDAEATTAKMGLGVDTRGGTTTQYKSHIVAYPSVVPNSKYPDGKYEWMPADTIELLPVPAWITKLTKKDIDKEDGSDDMETQVSLEQIQRMLIAIPPEVDHDEWKDIGMAIHSQHSGSEGMEIWDEWSQGTKIVGQYDRDTIRSKWRSFHRGGRIRIGTLFYYARLHGWEPTEEDSIKEVRNMKLEMLNTTHTMVTVGSRVRIVKEIEPIDKVMPHYIVMYVDDFRTMMCNEFIIRGDNDKPRPLADSWMKWKYRNSCPSGMGMFPSSNPEGWYNTWKGFAYKPVEGDWSKLYDHIREVVCNGHDSWAEWVLDWMADAIQNPENPPGTAIVMRGDEGVGKGTLADKFGRLFGYHYRHLSNDAHLTGNFNAHMMDALFVFADEITWGGNRKTAGVLKGLVTEKHLLGERKNIDAVSYRNMVRLMIASNSDWVVPADISSRRWFVVDVPNGKRNDFKYFAAIEDEFNNGGAEAMMHFMVNRKIKSELRKAPETDALAYQRSQSMHSSFTWWDWILQSGELDVPNEDVVSMEEMQTGEAKRWPRQVARMTVYSLYEEWCLYRHERRLPASTFYSHMKQMGMVDTRPVIEGIRSRHWLVPEHDEAVAILANKLGIKKEELI